MHLSSSEGRPVDEADLGIDVHAPDVLPSIAEGLAPVVEGESRRADRRLADELDEIAQHCARLPILDKRPPDEILGVRRARPAPLMVIDTSALLAILFRALMCTAACRGVPHSDIPSTMEHQR
jgi:hypothetical protein